ncbi:MAG TPA: alpha/beta hydrolase [Acidimicrobiales bacterium]|nr:alpha/beta hydrolase [Acidimicrobiales bacterium]
MRTSVEFRGREGIRLAADVAGEPGSPPVVFFHGGGQTRHAWGTTLDVLAGEGWRAYSVDLRGHGDSDWAPDGDYTLDAFAADVFSVATSLDPLPVLVGASLGGIASLAAVGESPSPIARALVLVDVAPRIDREGADRIGAFMMQDIDGFDSLDAVADAVAAYNTHRPRPTNLAGLKKNVRQRDDGRWYWHWDPAFMVGRFGSTDETRTSVIQPERLEAAAKTLTMPALLVRGRMSDLLTDDGSRQFLDLVPHAGFVEVGGAGHMVAGDRNDLFNDAIVEFLRSLS